jgi:magnesium transporter
VWIDLTASERTEARAILSELALLHEDVIDALLADESSNPYARYESYLHLALAVFCDDGELASESVHVVLGERFLLTVHAKAARFLYALRREYTQDFVQDFVRFAQTPSFLLYEIWDHLLQSYLQTQKLIESRVERVQEEFKSGSVDPQVFARVSALGAELLRFRQVVLPMRTVLADLATRNSPFVSDVTRAALSNLAGTIEHVLGDVLVDRELLSESLNLYMSLMSHRTNEIMRRLTVVSVVFMPLTFIVGVYGMNFDLLPELKWHYGYAYFWLLVLTLVGGLLVLMRRARLW